LPIQLFVTFNFDITIVIKYIYAFLQVHTEVSVMSLPCEVAVKCVLPVVRAMIAKELTIEHGLKQKEAACKLGVSQPAISLYGKKLRGISIDLENDATVKTQVRQIARMLAEGEPSRRNLIPKYCGICRAIRAKGLLCELHKAFDPTIIVEDCGLCGSPDKLTCI
jgi:predicted transcriptional regulator